MIILIIAIAFLLLGIGYCLGANSILRIERKFYNRKVERDIRKQF